MKFSKRDMFDKYVTLSENFEYKDSCKNWNRHKYWFFASLATNFIIIIMITNHKTYLYLLYILVISSTNSIWFQISEGEPFIREECLL